MWGMSWTIIERRKGNMLRRMIVTPVSRQNILLGLMTARVTMNFVEAALLMLFAWIYFDIEIQGSVPALIMVFFAGNYRIHGDSYNNILTDIKYRGRKRYHQLRQYADDDPVRHLFQLSQLPGVEHSVYSESAAHAPCRQHEKHHQ